MIRTLTRLLVFALPLLVAANAHAGRKASGKAQKNGRVVSDPAATISLQLVAYATDATD